MRISIKLAACLTALSLLAACAPAAQSPAPSVSATPDASPVTEPAVELRLTREEFPRLDGSTSTAPLARAVCAVLLGESREEVADLVRFSKTTRSYRQLMAGDADLLIAAEPADTVVQEKEEAGFAWEMEPIATDALVFLVNENNPVDSLTVEQVQKIYTGEITNWKEVGGEDRAIIPFQRNAEAGSQTLMKKLVMGELELMEPPKDYIVATMEGLIEAVRSFDGSPGAIGYTVYYYANDMNMAEGLKVVSIDGGAPDAASIRSGKYPFTNSYYAVIAGTSPANSPARRVFDWLRGPIGQSLIQHEGYVSILDDPAPVDWALGEAEPLREIYTRVSPDPLPELIPSDDYGPLLTYVGDVIEGEWWDYEKYGLVTREGRIVTDPVYDGAWRMSYFDAGKTHTTEILQLTRTLDTPGGKEERYALAAADGSWVTGFDWLWVNAVDDDHIWTVEPDGTGVMLDASLNELWRLSLPEGGEVWYYKGGMDGGMWWLGNVGTVYTGITFDASGKVLASEESGVTNLQGFYEGLSVAQPSGNWEKWGYVNQAGEWAIDPIFSDCRDFHNGKAIACLNDTWVVIDTHGEVLLEAEGDLSRRTGDRGDWYLDYDEVREDEGYYRCTIRGAYDADLNPIEWDLVCQTLDWGSEEWLYRSTDRGLELCSPYEQVLIPVTGQALLHWQEGDLLILLRETGADSTLWSVWKKDGTCILPETALEYVGTTADSVTGEKYFYLQEKGGASTLCDLKGNRLLKCTAYPAVTDGLVAVRTDLSYGYKTLDGEWVFRISLMKSQGD